MLNIVESTYIRGRFPGDNIQLEPKPSNAGRGVILPCFAMGYISIGERTDLGRKRP